MFPRQCLASRLHGVCRVAVCLVLIIVHLHTPLLTYPHMMPPPRVYYFMRWVGLPVEAAVDSAVRTVIPVGVFLSLRRLPPTARFLHSLTEAVETGEGLGALLGATVMFLLLSRLLPAHPLVGRAIAWLLRDGLLTLVLVRRTLLGRERHGGRG